MLANLDYVHSQESLLGRLQDVLFCKVGKVFARQRKKGAIFKKKDGKAWKNLKKINVADSSHMVRTFWDIVISKNLGPTL